MLLLLKKKKPFLAINEKMINAVESYKSNQNLLIFSWHFCYESFLKYFYYWQCLWAHNHPQLPPLMRGWSTPVFKKKTTLPGRSVFKSFINNESGCGFAPRNVSQTRWLQHWRHVSRINRQTRVSIFVSSPKGARYSSLFFSPSPLPFIPSIFFLLLYIRLLPSSFMSSPLLPRVCTQSQTSVAGKAKRRDVQDRVFF